jgi:hypothetical protein
MAVEASRAAKPRITASAFLAELNLDRLLGRSPVGGDDWSATLRAAWQVIETWLAAILRAAYREALKFSKVAAQDQPATFIEDSPNAPRL